MIEYRFYFKQPNDKGTGLEGTYQLYAFTNKKSLAKKFKESRNMDLCHMQKADVDAEDWLKHCKQNRLNIIKKRELSTTKVGTKTRAGMKNVTDTMIVCTEYEDAIIDDYLSRTYAFDDHGISSCYIPAPFIFTKEIRKSLESLYYHTFYISAMNDYPMVVRSKETNDYIEKMDSYGGPDIFIDELTVFIKTFWFTFQDKPFK